MVIADLNHVVLTRVFYGVTHRCHKTNIKRFQPREAETYGRLPFDIKAKVGPAFTLADLQKCMEANEIPAFYRGIPEEDQPPPDPADQLKLEEEKSRNHEDKQNKRKPTKKQEDPDEIITLPDLVDDEEEQEDTQPEEQDDKPKYNLRKNPKKRIRFQIDS